MNLHDQAKAIADKLNELDLAATATHDPAVAAGADGKPFILVTPPLVNYSTLTTTWTLVATIGAAPWNADTFAALASIVEELGAQESVPIESATPGSYPLITTQPPVPAYVLRLTATP